MVNRAVFRTLASAVSIGLTAALTAGCGQHNPLGPPVPEGATMINGPDSADPPPPPGWKQNPVVPASQQQAQDTIVAYLKKTLAALPAGTAVDASRYGGGITTVGCNDNDNSPTAPQEFSTWGDLNLPPGTDIAGTIAQVGDIWKSWGWYVIERDGFRKPNRFAYGPDDYRLQIEAAYPEGYPPTLSGVSPCFPGDVPKERTSFPQVLRAD